MPEVITPRSPDYLHEHGTRIKSLEVLFRWIASCVVGLILGGVWIVNMRRDVDFLQEEHRAHTQTVRQEEKAITIMQTQLEGIVSMLNKIDRKINP